ncbi:MAG TPA: type II toxin-antitoxin system RelE/ParE family toxin [Beijerinckiaceae bacterium]
MPRLRWLASARADLDNIYWYIARQSGSRLVAARFYDQLLRQGRKLASLPGTMGRARPELGEGIRSRAYRGYVVFFRYSGPHLEVVRVIEGHRDIDAAFGVEADPED